MVSINSTSYEGRGKEHPILTEGFFSFPLIPLPVKEATVEDYDDSNKVISFPLIPLPVKEATSGVRNTLD